MAAPCSIAHVSDATLVVPATMVTVASFVCGHGTASFSGIAGGDGALRLLAGTEVVQTGAWVTTLPSVNSAIEVRQSPAVLLEEKAMLSVEEAAKCAR